MHKHLIRNNRMRVAVVSILLSILVILLYIGIPFPLLYGQQEPFGIEEYRNSFFIIGIYAAPIITIIAIPVNLLAAYLTKRMERYKNIVSFVVHIIPAFLVGLVGGLFFCKYYGFGSYDFLYCRLPNNA